MAETRRRLLLGLAGGSLVALTGQLAEALPPQRAPQPLPSPNAPNPSYPPGFDGPEQTPDVKSVDPLKQEQVRADVEKLFELASELKREVEKSNASMTLSLPLLKKAQEIEKLAKKIKNSSKG